MPTPLTADPGLRGPNAVRVAPANRRAADPDQHGFPRGYQPPAEARPLFRDAAAKASVARSAVTAGADLASVLVTVLVAAWAQVALAWPAAWAVSIVAVLVVGRFGRAMECMVHEASHRNWGRHSRLNDLLANLLAGLATASKVEGYRAQHLVHHAHLGSREDPDIKRYEEFNLEELTGLRRVDLVKGIARRLPRYNWGWFVTIGTNVPLVTLSGLWYAVVIGGFAVIASPTVALVAWLHWLVGFALVLPIIRMIGESGEHRYLAGDTVFNSTISNLGWAHRFIVHPHADGHHTLHHMWSSVPHHQLAKVHAALAAADPDTYGGDIYWRAKVLDTPRQGLSS